MTPQVFRRTLLHNQRLPDQAGPRSKGGTVEHNKKKWRDFRLRQTPAE